MGGAGIKPDVHNVAFLGEVGMAANRATETLGHQLVGLFFKPDAGAVIVEKASNPIDGLASHNVLSALFAVEDGDGNAPDTLAGDTPVVALGNHGDHALFAPVGEPADAVAGFDSRVLDDVHRAEPLLGCPVNDGLFAAPAVGVGVGHDLFGQERAALPQDCQDGFVGLLIIESGELTGLIGHHALGVDWDDDADVGAMILIVLTADGKVLGAEAGGGMDAS
ncbi:hypothetical protein SDC9_69516 [bioreactor metagenome]|uniref:Uncharacterized protein n=1 Tax=bioreactor metagenome TaxID=1076179 RepID=A0A644Y901_9ZZZZ